MKWRPLKRILAFNFVRLIPIIMIGDIIVFHIIKGSAADDVAARMSRERMRGNVAQVIHRVMSAFCLLFPPEESSCHIIPEWS